MIILYLQSITICHKAYVLKRIEMSSGISDFWKYFIMKYFKYKEIRRAPHAYLPAWQNITYAVEAYCVPLPACASTSQPFCPQGNYYSELVFIITLTLDFILTAFITLVTLKEKNSLNAIPILICSYFICIIQDIPVL